MAIAATISDAWYCMPLTVMTMSPGRSASQAKPRPSAKTTARKNRIRIMPPSRLLHGAGERLGDKLFSLDAQPDLVGEGLAGRLRRVRQRVELGKRLGEFAGLHRHLHARHLGRHGVALDL